MNEQNIPERALVIKATVESGPEVCNYLAASNVKEARRMFENIQSFTSKDIIFRKVWYQDNRSETIALFF